MPRDDLLLAEMIDAAEKAVTLVGDSSVGDLESDRMLRDALLWNFTVLGEAAAQLSDELKTRQLPEFLALLREVAAGEATR